MMKRINAPTFGPIFTMVSEKRGVGQPFSSSCEVFDSLKADAQADREWLQVLYLDPKNNLIHQALEAVGSIDSAVIPHREIAKRALVVGASAVVLVHNHPSGDPEPSLCDRELTRDVIFALGVLGIKTLDHLVIGAKINGEQRYFSFADQGLIDDYDLMFSSLPLPR